jgi:hypothetical protein
VEDDDGVGLGAAGGIPELAVGVEMEVCVVAGMEVVGVGAGGSTGGGKAGADGFTMT